MTHTLREDELTIDRPLLVAIVRRRKRGWLALGLLVLSVVAVSLKKLVPQTYESTISISMQQASSAGGPLAGLMGVAATSKRHIGVLRSRRLAQEVLAKLDRAYRFRSLYGFKATDDVPVALAKSVKIDDDAMSGLLYVTVTMGGRPRLAPDPADLRHIAPRLAAYAANQYGEALSRYYQLTDNDRETVQQRELGPEIARATRAYEGSIERLTDFVRSRQGAAVATSAGSEASDADSAGTAIVSSDLPRLYASLGQVESQIEGAKAAERARELMVAGQLRNMTGIPAEDPLLAQARGRLQAARIDLANLRIQFGDAHPRVVQARQRLALAQKRLDEEARGIRRGATTDRVLTESEMAALRARHGVVMRLVAQAERRFQLSREYGADFARLRNDVTLKLETLKAISGQAAALGLQTVSAKNRVQVVDRAVPPRFGKPGIKTALLYGLASALSLVIVWLVVEYNLAPGQPGRQMVLMSETEALR